MKCDLALLACFSFLHFERTLDLLADVVQIVGELAEKKEVEAIARKMKEAKKSRANETFQLLGMSLCYLSYSSVTTYVRLRAVGVVPPIRVAAVSSQSGYRACEDSEGPSSSRRVPATHTGACVDCSDLCVCVCVLLSFPPKT